LGVTAYGIWQILRRAGHEALERRRRAAVLPIVPKDDPSEVLVFAPCERPRVSIVVPAHNNWPYTHLCLRAVIEHTTRRDYEVILADDGSTDQTANASSLLVNAAVVQRNARTGFVRNCNSGARHAQGDYVLFLNNDTVVQAGWLDALVDAAESDPKVGVVGPKLIYEDGRLQDAGGIVFADGTTKNRGRHGDASAPEYNRMREVDYVSGCCLLVRRDLWNRVGGFDERYAPAYYEDVDLAFAARREGFRVIYQPRAVVVHFDGVSHGHDTATGVKRFLAVNAQKLLGKWPEVLDKASPPGGDHPRRHDDVRTRAALRSARTASARPARRAHQ
jgi:GT2 family glycosyltransferase